MNEKQLFNRIHTVVGPASKVLLARFWLQMDARPTLPPFSFNDFRHLDAEGRSVFHSLVSSYRRQQFPPLAQTLVYNLNQLVHTPRYRETGKPAPLSPIRHAGRPAPRLPTSPGNTSAGART